MDYLEVIGDVMLFIIGFIRIYGIILQIEMLVFLKRDYLTQTVESVRGSVQFTEG